MAMGSTGTVNITPDMMKNALKVIEDFGDKTSSLLTSLTETVDTLLSSDFTGSAASGFKFFFDDKIVPALGTDLPKLISTLRDIVQGTLEAIPDAGGLDDELGTENRK